MVIPDDLLRCVGFVGYPTSADYEVAGTCFMLGRLAKREGFAFYYFVTAGHVIDEVRAQGKSTVSVRLNHADGYEWIDTDISQWLRHPDPTVDLALFADPFESTSKLDIYPFYLADATTDAWIERNPDQIGVGTELFVLGLFTNHYGKQKNLPIARSGMIAGMPHEKVQALVGGVIEEIDAYLLETRSMGGLSGSPVFAYLGHDRRTGGMHMGRTILLLGVMQGHFDELYDSVADAIDKLPDKRERKRINKGIGVAIPVQKVVEIIETIRSKEDEMEATLRATEGDNNATAGGTP